MFSENPAPEAEDVPENTIAESLVSENTEDVSTSLEPTDTTGLAELSEDSDKPTEETEDNAEENETQESQNNDIYHYNRVIKVGDKYYNAFVMDFNKIGEATEGQFENTDGFLVDKKESGAFVGYIEEESRYALQITRKELKPTEYIADVEHNDVEINLLLPKDINQLHKPYSDIIIYYSFHNDQQDYKISPKRPYESYFYMTYYCGYSPPTKNKINFGPFLVSMDVFPIDKENVEFIHPLGINVSKMEKDYGSKNAKPYNDWNRWFYNLWVSTPLSDLAVSKVGAPTWRLMHYIHLPPWFISEEVDLDKLPGYKKDSGAGVYEEKDIMRTDENGNEKKVKGICGNPSGDISLGVRFMNEGGFELRIYQVIIIFNEVNQ